ncbi:hypothetical protein BaRGS_00033218 [Batillaria attramentaria]|uniref:DNA damage-binding protein 1 n=1 Tax=Batillaria attramentaria TaxID=370345 RepID=A0ABD0JKW9_9CAEN
MAEEMIEAAQEEEQEIAAEMAAQFLNEERPESVFGAPKAGAGMWASCIRVLNPINGQTLQKIALEQNEAAHSIALVKFASKPDEQYLIVGLSRDLVLAPRSLSGGILHTYKVTEAGAKLELMHTTQVEEMPGAIAPFQGRVLIGVGRFLRIYDLGKKKLLRKCENKHIPNFVVTIHTMGQRVVVGDIQDSFHFVRYKRQENQLIVFADDTTPRWITCSTLLDYNTVAGADKFGNITVIRLPQEVSDDVDEDPTGNKALWDRGVLSGASQKIDIIANFHIGELVTSLQRATLIPGGSEALVYTTLSGGIGMLVPFTSHEDHDFFQHLEMYMRSEYQSIVGRDHLAYRSYYFPLKNMIDGDLCEMFNSIDISKQRSLAEELERTPSEVSKKLEDIRTRYAF